MNSKDPIGVIELGNKYIKCLIFQINNNSSEILSSSIIQAEGIHNDIVVNLSKAAESIRSCISSAEKKAKTSLKKINVIFEQPDFLCTKLSKKKKIDGSQIHKDDIDFLLKDAKKQLIHNDKNQSIIHIFNYNYIVDNKTFVDEPINVFADLLTHEMTFITAPKNNLRNIYQVFVDCDISVERLISKTFTLGAELLSDKELQSGSVLIDLGYEKISIGLFKNLAIVHSMTFPFGINHIAKDISKVCLLNLDESENIKNNFDYSFKNNKDIFDENDFLKNNFFVSSKFRKISKKLIINVIKERLDEIIEKIKKQLIVPGLGLNSGAKYILTGEGSNLINLERYFSNFFGNNVKKISNNLDQDSGSENNFTACLGAIKIIKDGWETEAIPKISDKNIKKLNFLDKIFKIYRQN